MSCKRLCSGRKNQLIEDSERLPRGLGIFLGAHRLLTSFIDFFKFRAAKCCGTNCDKIPLHGALDVAATAMASVVCGNVPKKESQRPGLFRDAFPCTRCKQEQDVPDDIVQKVDMILLHLQNCCPIENINCQIKNVLFILEETSDTMSERLRMLYFFLKEIMKNLLCCEQTLTESLRNTDTKMILCLVNNFLHDWTEIRSPARPCLKICRFCKQVVSKSSKQWGSFCCKEAHRFTAIWEEWALQQSISGSNKDECVAPKSKLKIGRPLDTDEGYTAGYPSETVAPPPSRTRYTDYDSTDTRSTEIDKARGPKDAPRKLIDERVDVSQDRDSAKTKGRPRGKAGRNLYRSKYPIRADGREERDDALYRGKPERARGPREEGTAAGKMRKIKMEAGDSRRDRAGKSRSESERRSDRSPKKKYRGARSASDAEEIDRLQKGAGDRGRGKIKRIRLNKAMTADDGGLDDSSRRRKTDRGRSRTRNAEPVKGDESADRVTPRGRGKRSHRRALSESERESVGWTNDTDDEGKTTRRRGRRKGEEKTEEVTGISKSKEARGRRKKKSADALDSERKEASRGVDEGENVLKRDGKRKGRAGRKTAKGFDSSAEDKSTLESEGRSKKETSARSKKGRGQPDSSRTDDDYSKINGSRYHKRKPNVGRLYDVEGHTSSIEYQLSNKDFIQRGWTLLPVAKTMKEIIHYRTEPAKPHLEWFRRYKNYSDIYYSNGSAILLKFYADESGEVFYPNGKVAIRVEKLENREYDMYTVFTPGGKDCVGVERDSQIVAVFDTMGNGAVFDEDGKTRLSYNQVGGIWRDNPTGLPVTWKWNANEKELLVGTVYEEKSTAHLEKFLSPPTKMSLKSSRTAKAPTSPASSRNMDKKVVEQKPVVAVHDEEEEVESGLDFHNPKETYCMSLICMKLNDFISLRILDRRNISLQFLAPGARSIRIELGTVLNRNEKVATYIVTSGSIATILNCKFDNLPLSDLKPDNSLYHLKQDLLLIRSRGRQRRFMIKKYQPGLRAWKKSKTRCSFA